MYRKPAHDIKSIVKQSNEKICIARTRKHKKENTLQKKKTRN